MKVRLGRKAKRVLRLVVSHRKTLDGRGDDQKKLLLRAVYIENGSKDTFIKVVVVVVSIDQ
jgi:hypothetical protein